MKTSKPFATISYNSPIWIEVKLNDLVRRRKIDFWAYVEHLPEEDEQKQHKHLYIVPNGQIDTDMVADCLTELNQSDIEHPFKCIRFRSSKFFDWYLYALHDTAYLASKGQSRKYHYKPEEVVCSDNDYLLEEVHQMDYTSLRRYQVITDAIKDGTPFEDLLRQGLIPFQQCYAYEHAYELIRNGRQTHTPKSIDEDTGEIMPEDT